MLEEGRKKGRKGQEECGLTLCSGGGCRPVTVTRGDLSPTTEMASSLRCHTYAIWSTKGTKRCMPALSTAWNLPSAPPPPRLLGHDANAEVDGSAGEMASSPRTCYTSTSRNGTATRLLLHQRRTPSSIPPPLPRR